MQIRLILFLVVLASCSFKKNPLENQTQSGHTELYSEPENPKNRMEDFQRVVIAATNDMHGHYQPHHIKFKDKFHNAEQTIQVGGIDYISSYFQILRKKFGQILLLDSGDIFSKNAKEMNYVSDFYSLLEYDAVTLGLKDFNLKLPAKHSSSSDFIQAFAAKSKTPLIFSNLYELKTARIVEWPGTKPYLIREVNGVKVGILGLIPDDIVEKTPVDNRIGLYVENMLQSTLRHSRLLRSLGAEIIVVLTHQKLNCGEELAQDLKLPMTKVNFDPEKKGVCDLSSKMGEYLTRLPPGLVDVVLTGRTDQKTVNVINSTLVLNGFSDGTGFSYVEFFVNKKTKKLQKDKTSIHQPVLFCQEFFKETNDCYTEDFSVDHKARVPATFLGEDIQSDSKLLPKFELFLKDKPTTSSIGNRDIQGILDFHGGDISYGHQGTGNSKLVLLNLKGSEMLTILETDYNQGLEASWQPSPFSLEKSSLNLSIQGSAIENLKEYKVLVDLEEAQQHPSLKKFISQAGNKSLNNVSWNDPGMENDNVSTIMSASDTVR